MRIENNLFIFKNNLLALNNKKNENKTYITNDMGYDSIAFTGRKPKDCINALGKAKKVISKQPEKTGKRHIKNSLHAQLNPETQKQIENMHKNLDTITEFFGQLKTNPPKAEKIKSGYMHLVTGTKKHGYTFTMGFPFEKNTMTISRSKNEPNLLRLVIETPEKEETHVLIDGFDKVVGNLNKKNPRFMPPKFRYMTVEELNNGYTKTYINMANSQLENFTQYLEKVTSDKPIRTRKNSSANTITKITNISPDLSRKQSISQLLDIFEKRAEEIPAHINPQISPSSKKVVMFSLKTEDGGILKASKRIHPDYNSDLRYVTIEKASPEGYKYCISIDLENKEILKCNKADGKPIVINDIITYYTPEELKTYNIENKFNSYMSEIFRAPKESDTPQEVTVLKLKNKPQNKINIEDLDISEIEDSKITEQIAKEQAKIHADENQKQISAIHTAQPVEEIKPVKKRGRKPKKQITNSQPTTNQSTNSTEKFKADIISKATVDANNLADEYYKIFVEQFKKAITEKISEFHSKLNDLFNN